MLLGFTDSLLFLTKLQLSENQEYNMFCDYDDANYFFHFHFGEWVGKKGCFLLFSPVVMKKFSSGYIRLLDLLLAPYITANRFF